MFEPFSTSDNASIDEKVLSIFGHQTILVHFFFNALKYKENYFYFYFFNAKFLLIGS